MVSTKGLPYVLWRLITLFVPRARLHCRLVIKPDKNELGTVKYGRRYGPSEIASRNELAKLAQIRININPPTQRVQQDKRRCNYGSSFSSCNRDFKTNK